MDQRYKLDRCPLCGDIVEMDEYQEMHADGSYTKGLAILCDCGVVLFGKEYDENDKIPAEDMEALANQWNSRKCEKCDRMLSKLKDLEFKFKTINARYRIVKFPPDVRWLHEKSNLVSFCEKLRELIEGSQPNQTPLPERSVDMVVDNYETRPQDTY